MKNIRPEFIIGLVCMIALLVFDGLAIKLKSDMNPFVLGLLIPWLIVIVLGFVQAWMGNLWASLYVSAITGFLHGILVTMLSGQRDIPQLFMGILFTVLCLFTCALIGLLGGLFARLLKRLWGYS